MRTTSARIGAEWRTNRKPIITPESRRSGTPGSATSGGFVRRIAMNIGTKKNAPRSSALPELNHAAIAPASAGTERARDIERHRAEGNRARQVPRATPAR